MNKKTKIKYKKFIRESWLYLIGGFFLFMIGSIRFLLFMPGIGANLKTQQPVVMNGSFILILGFGFFVIGVYRVKNKRKVFKDLLIIEREIEEMEELQR